VSKVVTDLSHKHNLKLIYATIEKGHRFSDAALNMAEDKNAVRPIEPNAKLTLSWAKYLKKLKTLKMYKSQVSLKHEPLHTLMHMLKAKTEWFFEI
jgi:serine acetyltransferase